jgi:hypothetical protein
MLDTQNQGPQCTACGSPMRLTAIEPSGSVKHTGSRPGCSRPYSAFGKPIYHQTGRRSLPTMRLRDVSVTAGLGCLSRTLSAQASMRLRRFSSASLRR